MLILSFWTVNTNNTCPVIINLIYMYMYMYLAVKFMKLSSIETFFRTMVQKFCIEIQHLIKKQLIKLLTLAMASVPSEALTMAARAWYWASKAAYFSWTPADFSACCFIISYFTFHSELSWIQRKLYHYLVELCITVFKTNKIARGYLKYDSVLNIMVYKCKCWDIFN